MFHDEERLKKRELKSAVPSARVAAEMLPSTTRRPPSGLMSARLKLHMLRWAREKPTTVIVVLIFVALALLSLLRRCPPCEACRRVAQPVAISALATAAAASSGPLRTPARM